MAKKFSMLDHRKHGAGGAIRGNIRNRKQDRRAQPGEFYVVAFFPKIHGIGKATLRWPSVRESIANTPDAARTIFMDGIAKGERWETYARAGHRIRKIKIVDLGDA